MIRLLHRIRLPLWLSEWPIAGMFWMQDKWGRGAVRWPVLRWLLATRIRKPTPAQIEAITRQMKLDGTYDAIQTNR